MSTEQNDPGTLVYTRCVFFRHSDTTLLERQVNYFLTYAPLANLVRAETNTSGDALVVTLWIEPMPGATSIDEVYAAAVRLGT